MFKKSHTYYGVMRREYKTMVTAYRLRAGAREGMSFGLLLSVFKEYRLRVRRRVESTRAAMRCRGY